MASQSKPPVTKVLGHSGFSTLGSAPESCSDPLPLSRLIWYLSFVRLHPDTGGLPRASSWLGVADCLPTYASICHQPYSFSPLSSVGTSCYVLGLSILYHLSPLSHFQLLALTDCHNQLWLDSNALAEKSWNHSPPVCL